MTPRPPIYGLLAEFDAPQDLVDACKQARQAGYRRMDAYTPYPIEAVAEAIGFHRNLLPTIVLIGGILGCIGGITLQYWVSVIEYPITIAGKPHFSWPLFVPIAFETTILCAALACVFGMLALNGLPMPYHPVFNVPQFAMASRDRFFLCLEATDPLFDRTTTRQFLERMSPLSVAEVEH
ncbi:MAG: DUF3341 domain-containing protein [Candidatus Binatia bacterium]